MTKTRPSWATASSVGSSNTPSSRTSCWKREGSGAGAADVAADGEGDRAGWVAVLHDARPSTARKAEAGIEGRMERVCDAARPMATGVTRAVPREILLAERPLRATLRARAHR